MTAQSAEGARFYSDSDVQTRIREYCGATADRGPTCVFVSELKPDGFATWDGAPRRPPAALPALFEAGWDISRSLRDTESLVVFFEVDAADPGAPEDALLRPAQTFFNLEPVYRAIQSELARYQLPLLDIMTGRGYHFSGQLPLTAPIVERLAGLGPRDVPWIDRAYTGLGMVLEHLAHRVHRRAASRIPVVFDGVEVGRGGVGREAVSLDLSSYGDPLSERQMRTAFSTYQNHRIRPDLFGDRAAREVPVLIAVPRRRRSLMWMLEHARTPEQARALARRENVQLPEVTLGIEHLLSEYETSPLHAFHRDFYADHQRGASAGAGFEDLEDDSAVPPCVGHALLFPNDALLKPTVLQNLTRYLMSRGWSAARVAALVRSKYSADYGWGDRWTRLDARQRADFDVRVFAGALVTELDTAIDFNCVSNQEQGLCPQPGCTHDLRVDRTRLLERLRR